MDAKIDAVMASTDLKSSVNAFLAQMKKDRPMKVGVPKQETEEAIRTLGLL